MKNSILCIIPARGGSKGVPRKNIELLNGKPLIEYVINAAKNSKFITDLIVSTDDEEIADISLKCGAKIPFLRPKELAQDSTQTEPVLFHAVEWFEKNINKTVIICLIQPTSPLLKTQYIDECLKILLENSDIDSVLTGFRYHGFRWKQKGDFFIPQYEVRKLRQDLEPEYQENGAFYAIRRESFFKFKNRIGGNIYLVEMPPEESLEIDTYSDFEYITYLMQKKGKKPKSTNK